MVNKNNGEIKTYSSTGAVRNTSHTTSSLLRKRRESVENREGNFRGTVKKKMFLSHQTYAGIIRNVHSLIEMVTYLLSDSTDHDYCYNDVGDIQNFWLTGRVSGDSQRRILDVIGVLADATRTLHYISLVMPQI